MSRERANIATANKAETKINRKVTECTELESQHRDEKRLGCFDGNQGVRCFLCVGQ